MTLSTAAKAFNVAGLNESKLKGQEEAFKTCLAFLKGVDKTKTQNKNRTSYGLKHLVENPSGHFDIPQSQDCDGGVLIYEGTFILAALATGFNMDQYTNGLRATFNIREPSLKRRAKEVCEERKRS